MCLERAVGPWGSVLVRIGLVVSVAGAFLSWTLFAAEIPYRAAKEGMLPDVFASENEKGSPAGALWITNILVQVFLIVTLFSNSTYLALFYIASTAILVPYVLSGAYAFKLAMTGESYERRTVARPRYVHRGSGDCLWGLARLCGRSDVSVDVRPALCCGHPGLLVGASIAWRERRSRRSRR